MTQKANISINDVIINVNQSDDLQSYICLTDMVRAYAGSEERTNIMIQNWMRLKDTIDYLGFWEKLKTQSGTNRFILTAKEWCEKTRAVGIISKAG